MNKIQKITLNPKTIVLILALVLGGFIRLSPVLSASFPLKDGGLFLAFIDTILNNHHALPTTIQYNGLSIPFAYPPLSFSLTAILSFVFNISPIKLLQYLPAVFSIISILVFYLLASTILESDRQICFSILSFALLPTAIDFMIVGSGLSRSLGYIFAILAIQQTWLLLTHSNNRHLVWSIIWTGLTILSHPVVSKFLIYSLLVIYFYKGRTKSGMKYLVSIACGAGILTSPWWITIISRFGIAPFINALQAAPQSWTSYLAVLLFIQTNEPYLHIQGFLSLIGLFTCLKKRTFWLPVWMGTVFLWEPRLVASYTILPTALLVGIGLDFLLKSLVESSNKNHVSVDSIPISTNHNNPLTIVPKIMLGFFLIYAVISTFIITPRQYLSYGNREAMAWIKNNLPANSQFLVISGIYGAGEDYISEWFPVLTGSQSMATPHGQEWINSQNFIKLWNNHDRLQDCGKKEGICMVEWGKTNHVHFRYIYKNKNQESICETQLLKTFALNSEYTLTFSNNEVEIFSTNMK